MKNRIRYLVAGLLLCGPCLIGCGGGVKEQDIQVSSANDPLSEPRSLLARYAEGQAIGSEAMGYPALVENVRKTDPARADILEQGFADLQAASPAKRKSIAEKLLEDLAPQMHADGPPADADEQPEE
ncbi:hypothetical protein [Roseimaritima ulvae]|uniref:Uncharacterized protein n=1 Tax=Roseimaritima ulvae TaxID=980254 RepID=A0A5B9QL61_9BACT|nr:hypothetical protein [Roseimaritima ulvae]QEG38749.1 hypothetical protein UC8_07070 [Roseimaritima ulvae]